MSCKNRQKTFKWLNATQFFGALNDNLFRLSMVFFLIASNPGINADSIMANTGVIFVLPFLLFSDTAGVLADRISKRAIIVRLKVVEMILMSIGCLCFYIESSIGLYCVLFLMCTQSAFFGPAKYGIIPELVSSKRLSWANSYIISATFISIIIGTAMASVLAGGQSGYVLCGTACIIISLSGFLVSIRVYKTPSARGTGTISPFFFIGIWKTIKSVSKDTYLLMAVFTSSYFWMIAAYTQMNLVPYGIELMNLSPENSHLAGYLYLIVAVGVGAGALLAGVLSGRKIEFGIVPIGAISLAFSLIGLYFSALSFFWAVVLIVFMGMSAGLFLLPLNAFIQFQAPDNKRGAVLAATNFLNFVGILCASMMIKVFQKGLGFSPGQAFMLIGIMTFILGTVVTILLKNYLFNFVMQITAKIFAVQNSSR